MAAFVDTNVLLYGVSTVRDEADKQVTARAILDRDDIVLSVQVLREFYVQATRSTKTDRIGNCPMALSENLQPGMNFAGVTVRNPFT